MLQLDMGDGLLLRSLRTEDAPALLAAVDADREHFERWLRWAGGVGTIAEAEAFIGRAAEAEREGRGFHLGLWRAGVLLGGVPCWSIDPVHRVAELGYWLSPGVRGGGLARRATEAVMGHLFGERGVHRIEFQCRTENEASRRLAERVGGQLEGIRRGSHFVGGEFRDHALYAVLAPEWRGGGTRRAAVG